LLLLCALQAQAAPVGAPFLWQVDGGATRHFLVGSIHLLPESALPLPAALDDAYAQSQGIVLESDLATLSAPDTQLQLLASARSDKPEGLKAQIPATLYAHLRERAQALGMPMALCDGFKPWFCALTLEVFSFQHAGFDTELGIDQHYFERANADNKAVRWLEPPEEHLGLFTQMPESLSEQFLAATVEEQTEDGGSPAELLRIWHDNDLAGLEKAGRDLRTHFPKAYERLLSARNRNWVPRLAELFKSPTPLMVIVGAAHLPGPDGLIALLREQGYRVEPYLVDAPPTAVPAPSPSAPVAEPTAAK
jgi:uncharacterized protein YbaP (TraB family)